MFTKSTEVESYAKAIIEVFNDRFEHLEDCRTGYLFSQEIEIVIQGKKKDGYACMPTAMGQNRKLYEWALEEAFGFLPDALIVVWEEGWLESEPEDKVILVFHELMHIAHKTNKDGEPMYSNEDGRPQYCIGGHDVEEFKAVAEVFGDDAGWQEFAKNLQNNKRNPKMDEVITRVREIWKPE